MDSVSFYWGEGGAEGAEGACKGAGIGNRYDAVNVENPRFFIIRDFKGHKNWTVRVKRYP